MDLVVGRIAKAHGITGEVVVEVRTDDPDERFAVGNRLRLTNPRRGLDREVSIAAMRPHSGRLLLRLDGVPDRDGAAALRGSLFVVDTAELPPIDDPDEFYDHQLEGLTARTVGGDVIGTVTEVLHTPGTELLSIRTEAGAEVLVPFVSEIVTEVSLSDGVITVDPPEGLLDLDS